MRDPTAGAPAITAADVELVLAEPERIELVAQPIVDLRRGAVVGYETLARFSLGKPSPPDRVFAAASAAGLGEELEATVVGLALDLGEKRPPNCFLTMNVDPRHLVSPRVWSVIEARRDLGGLVFELTEHRSIEDLTSLRRALETLRERGAFVAIDDAGSGYSGLKQILELRPQFLKIDRDLVTDVHANEAKRALIQMLGELAGRLDAWVIAEGMETEAELHALCQLGIPLGQGYFLGRPSPPWSGVDAKGQHALAKLAIEGPADPGVTGLVEPCAVSGESSEWPSAPIGVRVRESGRPTAMRLVADGVERVRAGHELLRVKRGASMADLGLRAATRPERLRWDPLVCVDERGRFQGVIPMQRLVCALATEPERSEAALALREADGEDRRTARPRTEGLTIIRRSGWNAGTT